MLEVVREELALGVVAREAQRRLGEVVRAERAEVGELGDLVGPDAGARQLDHRAAQVLDRRLLGRDALGQLAQARELLAEADERVHDLDERRRRPCARRRRRRRARSPAPASRRSPGHCRPSRQPRVPSIGFASCSSPIRRRIVVRGRLLERGQELVQRRVEQADRDREARPSPRRSPRSRTAAAGSSLSSAARRPASSRAMIISCTIGSRSWAMNMCSVRQRPMPSAPNSRALAASSGVSAFARTRSRRSSSAQSRIVPKFSSIAGGTSRTGPTITRPVPPSIVITSPAFSCAPRSSPCRRARRSRGPRSPPRTACPSRARRPPRARSCRRAR